MNDLAQKTGVTGIGGAGVPAHQVIYGQLRELVLFGEIAPGDAVTIQGLCTRLGAGMTPVREGMVVRRQLGLRSLNGGQHD